MDLIKDSLSRSDQMTESMICVLTSFEDRLKKLEETINPVYQETGNLQRRHESILLVKAFDDVMFNVG